MDYSLRIPATEKRIKILEEKSTSKKLLPKIKDILFKPKEVPLTNFNPNNICIRLREFTDEHKPSTLLKLTFTKTKTGYTDEREDLGLGITKGLLQKAKDLGYEKWGQVSTQSVEYDLGNNIQVLSQELKPVGTILKIESKTQSGLDKAMKLLSVHESEKIEKNAAVLLAEKLKLMSTTDLSATIKLMVRVTTLRSAQKFVKDFAKTNKWEDYPNIDKFDHLHEELIEMSKLLRYKTEKEKADCIKKDKEEFVDGIGDLFFGTCRLANQLNVDIEDAFNLVRKRIISKYKNAKSEAKPKGKKV